jgi:sugar phosphate isomerase/epimerase
MGTHAIKLGMPTLIELEDLASNVALAGRLGLSFIELNMNCPQYGPSSLPAEHLRQIGRAANLEFTVHLPEESDLAAFDPDVRAGHLACCRRAIQWAGQAQIRVLNLHLRPGVYFSLPDRRVYLYERYAPQYLANLIESFGVLLADARRADVTICLENTGLLAMDFLVKAADALLALDEMHVALTWDIGHDAASGWSEKPVFEKRLGRVGHMHLHDARAAKAHLALFTGQVDVAWAMGLAAARRCRVVIETKTAQALEQSIAELDRRCLRGA